MGAQVSVCLGVKAACLSVETTLSSHRLAEARHDGHCPEGAAIEDCGGDRASEKAYRRLVWNTGRQTTHYSAREQNTRTGREQRGRSSWRGEAITWGMDAAEQRLVMLSHHLQALRTSWSALFATACDLSEVLDYDEGSEMKRLEELWPHQTENWQATVGTVRCGETQRTSPFEPPLL